MSTEKPVDFFRNFNRLVGVAYVAIVALTLGFFWYQIDQKRDEEIALLLGHVDRHGQLIEFVLRNSVDHLEASRITANDFYAGIPKKSGNPALKTALISRLRHADAGQRFHLDNIEEPDSSGNLTGDGRLDQRSSGFYRDITMALQFARNFQAINLSLPNAVSARFVSKESFSYLFPWQESAKERFSRTDYQRPTWQMGTPEANPTRARFWAPVYYGGKDKGLVAPVGVPIYDGPSFRGVVSIETSLDYLNRLNADFGYPLGTSVLIDASAQVLAHPGFYASPLEVLEPPPFAKVFPAGILPATLLDLPVRTPTRLGSYIVIRYAFLNAPWNLVYLLPSGDLSMKLFSERGVAMLAIVIALTLMMLVTYYVTAREFIAPASKLVQYIAAESQFEASPIPAVPSAWRPWFERISEAFKESIQLIGIRQELDIAAKMQLSILPREWPRQPEFELWGTMRSAKEVGGDFYDHFPLSGGRIGIVCADVSGKGVPAALFGMVSRTLIRAICTRSEMPAAEHIAIVNDILSEDNDACVFVTAFYGIFNPGTGELVYVNAGHPPPLQVHADGRSEFLQPTQGAALGVFADMRFSQASAYLDQGDFLFIYTDGVTEAFNALDEQFSATRLLSVFKETCPADTISGVQRIVAEVDTHVSGAAQSDDITCVGLGFRLAQKNPGEPDERRNS